MLPLGFHISPLSAFFLFTNPSIGSWKTRNWRASSINDEGAILNHLPSSSSSSDWKTLRVIVAVKLIVDVTQKPSLTQVESFVQISLSITLTSLLLSSRFDFSYNMASLFYTATATKETLTKVFWSQRQQTSSVHMMVQIQLRAVIPANSPLTDNRKRSVAWEELRAWGIRTRVGLFSISIAHVQI
jgi:hypothetical protein